MMMKESLKTWRNHDHVIVELIQSDIHMEKHNVCKQKGKKERERERERERNGGERKEKKGKKSNHKLHACVTHAHNRKTDSCV